MGVKKVKGHTVRGGGVPQLPPLRRNDLHLLRLRRRRSGGERTRRRKEKWRKNKKQKSRSTRDGPGFETCLPRNGGTTTGDTEKKIDRRGGGGCGRDSCKNALPESPLVREGKCRRRRLGVGNGMLRVGSRVRVTHLKKRGGVNRLLRRTLGESRLSCNVSRRWSSFSKK